MDDAIAVAMQKAYGARASYDGRSAFTTWVCGIAKNVAIDEVRRLRRHQSLSLDVATADGRGNNHTGGEFTITLGERQAARDEIAPATVRLDLADVVALAAKRFPKCVGMAVRIAQGHQLEEIAALDAIPLGTVKSRVYRGRKALRQATEELAFA